MSKDLGVKLFGLSKKEIRSILKKIFKDGNRTLHDIIKDSPKWRMGGKVILYHSEKGKIEITSPKGKE